MIEADSIKALWQCQAVEANVTSVQTLRERGDRLRRYARIGNAAGYTASAAMIIWVGYDLGSKPKDLVGTFIYVFLIGIYVWIMSVLRLLGRVSPAPASDAFHVHLDYLIDEYERRLALQKKEIRWFLIPSVVGAMLLMAHKFYTAVLIKPNGLGLGVLVVITTVLIMGGIVGVFIRARRANNRRSQRTIDALKATRNDMRNGAHDQR
jgi:hypothetical protein